MAPSSDFPQDPQYILDHQLEFLENSQYACHPVKKNLNVSKFVHCRILFVESLCDDVY
jgi:hypothetical protein